MAQASWQGKVVVVTGGSEGLGLAISRAFFQANATVVMLARDESKLDLAVNNLDDRLAVGSIAENPDASNLPPRISGVAADVTDDQSVAEAIAEVLAIHGRIDVLINNVGQSCRVRFADAEASDYQRLMDINFYSAVRTTMAALPALVTTSGQVINIGSLAAKTAWPNVGPYATSKHALACFSHQLRVEAPENVHCMLVCPGPIRRDDAGVRYAGSQTDAAAKAPGAGVRLKGICPDRLASRIVVAAGKRQRELIVPRKSRVLFVLAQLSPWLGDWLLKKMAKKK